MKNWRQPPTTTTFSAKSSTKIPPTIQSVPNGSEGAAGKDADKSSAAKSPAPPDCVASGTNGGDPEVKKSTPPPVLPPPAPPPDAPADAGGHFGKPRYTGKEGEIYVDAASKRFKSYTYIRGDCTLHPWHDVDESGSRIMGESVRPPDTPAKIWSKMTEYQQQSDALDSSLGRPGRVKDHGGGESTASGAESLLPSLPPVVSGPNCGNTRRSSLRRGVVTPKGRADGSPEAAAPRPPSAVRSSGDRSRSPGQTSVGRSKLRSLQSRRTSGSSSCLASMWANSDASRASLPHLASPKHTLKRSA